MWNLDFFYFNNKGGVEEWHINGKAQNIEAAKAVIVAPDKTFLFPFG
jgi:hypothetical protein